jgi:hypoxanthine phosphoribosyltransferase
MKSYNYKTRQGVKEISWDKFHKMGKNLAEEISKTDFDLIIGITRAGLYPATLIAGMLRKEIYPIRLTRRGNDQIKYKKPIWKLDVPDVVRGKKIMVIDEIADSGDTLSIVSQRLKSKGASSVETAVLLTHSWSKPKPDYFVLESDELIIFPWDKNILVDHEWVLHPELAEAIKLQKK